MYERFIEFLIRRPGLCLAAVVLVTVGLASRLPDLRVESDQRVYMAPGTETRENLDLLEDLFGSIETVLVIVMREDHPDGIYNPETLAVIDEITEWLRRREELETSRSSDLRSLSTINDIVGDEQGLLVRPFMEFPPETREEALAIRSAIESNSMYVGQVVSYDGKGAIIVTKEADTGGRQGAKTYFDLREYLDGLNARGHPEVFHVTGSSIVQGLVGEYVPQEGQRLLPFVLLTIVVCLFLSFRTLRGVLIPYLVVALTELWMFGFLALWGKPVYTLTALLPVLIVSIAVADSIHLLAKYYDAQYEFPDAGRDVIIRETMLEMGRPVFMTSLTTAVGFLAMTSSELVPMQEFGIITAVGIASAFVLTLLLIPAILALLPLQRPRMSRRRQHVDTGSLLSRALLASASSTNLRPWMTVASFATIALLATIGISRSTVDSAAETNFKPSHPVRIAHGVINDHFSGSTVLDVLVDGLEPDAMKNPALLRKIDLFQAEMEKSEGVGATFSLAETVKRMNRVMNEDRPEAERIPESRELVAQYLLLYSISGDPGDFDDLVDYDYRWGHIYIYLDSSSSALAKRMVARARELCDEIFSGEPRVETRPAGWAHGIANLEAYFVRGQWRTLLICAPLLVALAGFMLGRLSLGLLAVAPVLFSIMAIFATMGFAGLSIDMATIVLSGITLGVGIDFAIHYLGRYVALEAEGVGHQEACSLIAATTGRALFFNALVLSGGFLVLLGARFDPHVKIGALVSATMVICYLTTMYLYPALLGLAARRRESRK